MNTRVSLLVLFLFSQSVLAIRTQDLRCGGDGPKPFKDITSGFMYQTRVIGANSGVKEFQYWDDKDQLIYRNSRDEVRGMSAAEGFPVHEIFANSSQPLSSVQDPFEQFLLTQNPPRVLNTRTHAWAHYSTNSAATPLFVEKSSVYSIQTYRDQTGKALRTDVYKYDADRKMGWTVCTLYPPVSDDYKIAHGSRFPYIYMWSHAKIAGRNDIFFYGVNLRTCSFDPYLRLEGIRYPVQDLYVFPNDRGTVSYLIKVDHPRENVLWRTDTGCQYYDMGNLSPVVLSYSEPTVATWSPKTGIQLVFLKGESRARIMGDFPIQDLNEGDLKMSRNGNRLFLAPRFRGGAKYLMSVRLDQPYGPIPTQKK